MCSPDRGRRYLRARGRLHGRDHNTLSPSSEQSPQPPSVLDRNTPPSFPSEIDVQPDAFGQWSSQDIVTNALFMTTLPCISTSKGSVRKRLMKERTPSNEQGRRPMSADAQSFMSGRFVVTHAEAPSDGSGQMGTDATLPANKALMFHRPRRSASAQNNAFPYGPGRPPPRPSSPAAALARMRLAALALGARRSATSPPSTPVASQRHTTGTSVPASLPPASGTTSFTRPPPVLPSTSPSSNLTVSPMATSTQPSSLPPPSLSPSMPASTQSFQTPLLLPSLSVSSSQAPTSMPLVKASEQWQPQRRAVRRRRAVAFSMSPERGRMSAAAVAAASARRHRRVLGEGFDDRKFLLARRHRSPSGVPRRGAVATLVSASPHYTGLRLVGARFAAGVSFANARDSSSDAGDVLAARLERRRRRRHRRQVNCANGHVRGVVSSSASPPPSTTFLSHPSTSVLSSTVSETEVEESEIPSKAPSHTPSITFTADDAEFSTNATVTVAEDPPADAISTIAVPANFASAVAVPATPASALAFPATTVSAAAATATPSATIATGTVNASSPSLWSAVLPSILTCKPSMISKLPMEGLFLVGERQAVAAVAAIAAKATEEDEDSSVCQSLEVLKPSEGQLSKNALPTVGVMSTPSCTGAALRPTRAFISLPSALDTSRPPNVRRATAYTCVPTAHDTERCERQSIEELGSTVRPTVACTDMLSGLSTSTPREGAENDVGDMGNCFVPKVLEVLRANRFAPESPLSSLPLIPDESPCPCPSCVPPPPPFRPIDESVPQQPMPPSTIRMKTHSITRYPPLGRFSEESTLAVEDLPPDAERIASDDTTAAKAWSQTERPKHCGVAPATPPMCAASGASSGASLTGRKRCWAALRESSGAGEPFRRKFSHSLLVRRHPFSTTAAWGDAANARAHARVYGPPSTCRYSHLHPHNRCSRRRLEGLGSWSSSCSSADDMREALGAAGSILAGLKAFVASVSSTSCYSDDDTLFAGLTTDSTTTPPSSVTLVSQEAHVARVVAVAAAAAAASKEQRPSPPSQAAPSIAATMTPSSTTRPRKPRSPWPRLRPTYVPESPNNALNAGDSALDQQEKSATEPVERSDNLNAAAVAAIAAAATVELTTTTTTDDEVDLNFITSDSSIANKSVISYAMNDATRDGHTDSELEILGVSDEMLEKMAERIAEEETSRSDIFWPNTHSVLWDLSTLAMSSSDESTSTSDEDTLMSVAVRKDGKHTSDRKSSHLRDFDKESIHSPESLEKENCLLPTNDAVPHKLTSENNLPMDKARNWILENDDISSKDDSMLEDHVESKPLMEAENKAIDGVPVNVSNVEDVSNVEEDVKTHMSWVTMSTVEAYSESLIDNSTFNSNNLSVKSTPSQTRKYGGLSKSSLVSATVEDESDTVGLESVITQRTQSDTEISKISTPQEIDKNEIDVAIELEIKRNLGDNISKKEEIGVGVKSDTSLTNREGRSSHDIVFDNEEEEEEEGEEEEEEAEKNEERVIVIESYSSYKCSSESSQEEVANEKDITPLYVEDRDELSTEEKMTHFLKDLALDEGEIRKREKISLEAIEYNEPSVDEQNIPERQTPAEEDSTGQENTVKRRPGEGKNEHVEGIKKKDLEECDVPRDGLVTSSRSSGRPGTHNSSSGWQTSSFPSCSFSRDSPLSDIKSRSSPLRICVRAIRSSSESPYSSCEHFPPAFDAFYRKPSGSNFLTGSAMSCGASDSRSEIRRISDTETCVSARRRHRQVVCEFKRSISDASLNVPCNASTRWFRDEANSEYEDVLRVPHSGTGLSMNSEYSSDMYEVVRGYESFGEESAYASGFSDIPEEPEGIKQEMRMRIDGDWADVGFKPNIGDKRSHLWDEQCDGQHKTDTSYPNDTCLQLMDPIQCDAQDVIWMRGYSPLNFSNDISSLHSNYRPDSQKMKTLIPREYNTCSSPVDVASSISSLNVSPYVSDLRRRRSNDFETYAYFSGSEEDDMPAHDSKSAFTMPSCPHCELHITSSTDTVERIDSVITDSDIGVCLGYNTTDMIGSSILEPPTIYMPSIEREKPSNFMDEELTTSSSRSAVAAMPPAAATRAALMVPAPTVTPPVPHHIARRKQSPSPVNIASADVMSSMELKGETLSMATMASALVASRERGRERGPDCSACGCGDWGHTAVQKPGARPTAIAKDEEDPSLDVFVNTPPELAVAAASLAFAEGRDAPLRVCADPKAPVTLNAHASSSHRSFDGQHSYASSSLSEPPSLSRQLSTSQTLQMSVSQTQQNSLKSKPPQTISSAPKHLNEEVKSEAGVPPMQVPPMHDAKYAPVCVLNGSLILHPSDLGYEEQKQSNVASGSQDPSHSEASPSMPSSPARPTSPPSPARNLSTMFQRSAVNGNRRSTQVCVSSDTGGGLCLSGGLSGNTFCSSLFDESQNRGSAAGSFKGSVSGSFVGGGSFVSSGASGGVNSSNSKAGIGGVGSPGVGGGAKGGGGSLSGFNAWQYSQSTINPRFTSSRNKSGACAQCGRIRPAARFPRRPPAQNFVRHHSPGTPHQPMPVGVGGGGRVCGHHRSPGGGAAYSRGVSPLHACAHSPPQRSSHRSSPRAGSHSPSQSPPRRPLLANFGRPPSPPQASKWRPQSPPPLGPLPPLLWRSGSPPSPRPGSPRQPGRAPAPLWSSKAPSDRRPASPWSNWRSASPQSTPWRPLSPLTGRRPSTPHSNWRQPQQPPSATSNNWRPASPPTLPPTWRPASPQLTRRPTTPTTGRPTSPMVMGRSLSPLASRATQLGPPSPRSPGSSTVGVRAKSTRSWTRQPPLSLPSQSSTAPQPLPASPTAAQQQSQPWTAQRLVRSFSPPMSRTPRTDTGHADDIARRRSVSPFVQSEGHQTSAAVAINSVSANTMASDPRQHHSDGLTAGATFISIVCRNSSPLLSPRQVSLVGTSAMFSNSNATSPTIGTRSSHEVLSPRKERRLRTSHAASPDVAGENLATSGNAIVPVASSTIKAKAKEGRATRRLFVPPRLCKLRARHRPVSAARSSDRRVRLRYGGEADTNLPLPFQDCAEATWRSRASSGRSRSRGYVIECPGDSEAALSTWATGAVARRNLAQRISVGDARARSRGRRISGVLSHGGFRVHGGGGSRVRSCGVCCYSDSHAKRSSSILARRRAVAWLRRSISRIPCFLKKLRRKQKLRGPYWLSPSIMALKPLRSVIGGVAKIVRWETQEYASKVAQDLRPISSCLGRRIVGLTSPTPPMPLTPSSSYPDSLPDYARSNRRFNDSTTNSQRPLSTADTIKRKLTTISTSFSCNTVLREVTETIRNDFVGTLSHNNLSKSSRLKLGDSKEDKVNRNSTRKTASQKTKESLSSPTRPTSAFSALVKKSKSPKEVTSKTSKNNSESSKSHSFCRMGNIETKSIDKSPVVPRTPEKCRPKSADFGLARRRPLSLDQCEVQNHQSTNHIELTELQENPQTESNTSFVTLKRSKAFRNKPLQKESGCMLTNKTNGNSTSTSSIINSETKENEKEVNNNSENESDDLIKVKTTRRRQKISQTNSTLSLIQEKDCKAISEILRPVSPPVILLLSEKSNIPDELQKYETSLNDTESRRKALASTEEYTPIKNMRINSKMDKRPSQCLTSEIDKNLAQKSQSKSEEIAVCRKPSSSSGNLKHPSKLLVIIDNLKPTEFLRCKIKFSNAPKSGLVVSETKCIDDFTSERISNRIQIRSKNVLNRLRINFQSQQHGSPKELHEGMRG